MWSPGLCERWQGVLTDANTPGMAAHHYCRNRYYSDSQPSGYDGVIVDDVDGKQERFDILVELEPHFIAYPSPGTPGSVADGVGGG